MMLLLLLSVAAAAAAADPHAPEVHTKLGSLRGDYVTVKGKDSGVHVYLGVPFAKPPLGSGLRLSAPQPAEAWEGIRNATKQPPICVQSKEFLDSLLDTVFGQIAEFPAVSEDCLYLNIYTPSNRAPDAKLPVMVWIHGGGFTLGSASMYDGSALSAYQDAVVVLIQYRLGALGFLSSGDEEMPGNYGLLDQVQALRWVHEHIHNFGGNPDSVTVFGESAGGVSVSLLLLSPMAEGLVHGGIAESGTAAMDVLISADPAGTMRTVANISGCDLKDSKTMSHCMRNADLDTFLSLSKDILLRYTVTVDGQFLTKPVDQLFSKREILNVPFMTGVNNHEGGYLLANYFAPPNWTEGMDKEHFSNMLSLFFPDPSTEPIRELVMDQYIGSGEDRVKNRDGYTEMIGDMMFGVSAIKAVNAHRDAGLPVFLYEYRYPPAFLQQRRPSFVKSDHGDELFTVFAYCLTTAKSFYTVECSDAEVDFSKTIMNYWGNFARSGSPNGPGLVHWPRYGSEEKYLVLDLKEQKEAQYLMKDNFVFFTQTLPEKIQKLQQTPHPEL